jgi:pyruvate,water dikinase
VGFSLTQLIGARLPGLTVPVWNGLWVGDHPDMPEYVEQPTDVNPLLTEKLAAKSAWALTTTTFPEVDESLRRANAARDGRPDLSTLTDLQLVERAESFVPDLVYGYSWHVPTTSLSTMGPAVAGALLATIGEQDALGALLSGIGGVDSAAPSFAMWALGREAAESDVVTAAFDRGVEQVLLELRASDDPSAQKWLQGFDDLIYRYGSRAPNEWDLRSDSWETKPELAISAIDGMRKAGPEADPSVALERNKARREQLTQELAGRMPDDASRQSFLDAAASITRFMPWRERTKTAAVKVMGEVRAAVFELGERMVARGVIGDRRDITMLMDTELKPFVEDPESFADVIARRSVEYQQLFRLEPPFFLTENLPLSQWKVREEQAVTVAQPGDALQGVPGSPGKARGRARIITDPYEPGDFEQGDVLVAPQTDPAWTPLFVTAAAVVVNVGALITHAVIVCRELGLPCAVSVQDATLRIPDGAMVEVDGSTGAVVIL